MSASISAPQTASRTDILMEGRGLERTFVTGEVSVRALRGVDISLKRGELVVLLGHSGSGKSTLLNILGGLDRATAGTLRFEPFYKALQGLLMSYVRTYRAFRSDGRAGRMDKLRHRPV